MKKLDIWWWLSVPYGFVFFLFSDALHLPEAAVAHALAPFFLLALVCTCSSIAWLVVTVYKISAGKAEVTGWALAATSIVAAEIFLCYWLLRAA